MNHIRNRKGTTKGGKEVKSSFVEEEFHENEESTETTVTNKGRVHGSDDKEKDDSNDSEENEGNEQNEQNEQNEEPPIIKTKRKFLHVAPMNIPLSRRLETVGIIWHTICIPLFIILFLSIVSLGWISWVFIVLPYFIWWYGFDLHTPTNGKAAYRSREWVRNLMVWKWFVDYFPIRAHKSCDLEPTFTYETMEDDVSSDDDEQDLISETQTTLIDKVFMKMGLVKRLNNPSKGKLKKVSTGPRYIFGYHPHGVISMGVMGTFATNILRNEPFEPPLSFLKPIFYNPMNKNRLLPNIGTVFPLTLTTQFTLPFYRDYLLSLGLTSASATNIKSLIKNGDNSVCIVVGGAQESLLNSGVSDHHNLNGGSKNSHKNEKPPESDNKQIRLVLNKRKGFIKLAIELGNINLVPIFGFGEADIYNIIQPKPGSIGHWFQQWMKKHFYFTVPFFSARGIFIYDFGFLPYRNPINICIGRPIHVPSNLIAKDKDKSSKKPKISSELLDHYHKLYGDELKRVFEENKAKFGYENVELNIVE